jgi:hypothetical protein
MIADIFARVEKNTVGVLRVVEGIRDQTAIANKSALALCKVVFTV